MAALAAGRTFSSCILLNHQQIQPERSGKCDGNLCDFYISIEERVVWLNAATLVSSELHAHQQQSGLCNCNVRLPAHFGKALK